jgi:hypothetical protein
MKTECQDALGTTASVVLSPTILPLLSPKERSAHRVKNPHESIGDISPSIHPSSSGHFGHLESLPTIMASFEFSQRLYLLPSGHTALQSTRQNRLQQLSWICSWSALISLANPQLSYLHTGLPSIQ